MKTIAALSLILTTTVASAGTFTIGGFTFDENNAVKTVKVAEGTANLKTRSDSFGKYSEAYRRDSSVRTNEFANFNRSKTVGRILSQNGDTRKSSSSRHVLLPDIDDAPPKPNSERIALEVAWNGDVLRNLPGNDFVIYEAGNWEGFALSVLKSGSSEWTAPRYQFADSFDATHDVNAVAFDLSNLGIAENETITAIRISNLFNEKAPGGADKVDNEIGQGIVIRPNDPKYNSSFTLRTKPSGKEFKTELLDADIVYVVGLHDIEARK